MLEKYQGLSKEKDDKIKEQDNFIRALKKKMDNDNEINSKRYEQYVVWKARYDEMKMDMDEYNKKNLIQEGKYQQQIETLKNAVGELYDPI